MTIPMARPEDLVVMKGVAGRPQDCEDIRWLLRSHPGIDRERLHALVQDFANVLDSPELVESLEALFREIPRD
jgi:hypothetical protein